MDTRAILAALSPGDRVFLPGSAGEIAPLTQALCAPDAVPLDITASFVPGINPTPPPLAPGARFTNPFALWRGGVLAGGQARHLPVSYAVLAKRLSETSFDVCILHVALPDAAGMASLGPAVEFAPIVAANARRVIAVVNPNLPSIPGAAAFRLAEAALVAETDAPLRTYEPGEATAEAQAIAAAIAAFIRDGATLQIGIGKVPDALLRALTDRRGLRLHSGMLSDGMRALAEAGALDPDHVPTSCVHVGSQAHYDWLRGRPGIAVAPVSETHAPATLGGLARLVAVNGAISVDLFGQANLESIGPRAVSGVGGAADFAAAAARAPGGISIVGLPAGGPKGASRIIARLDGPVSLARHDIDVVVTDHGAADLRGAGVTERAERLIAVAAPEHRGALGAAWREIAAGL